MITRRFLLQAAAAGDAYSSGLRAARAENAPGVRSARPRPTAAASAYGVLGRTQAAYFKMINEQGGVNGRKLNLMSFDEGYSPPKAVEQTRVSSSRKGSPSFSGVLALRLMRRSAPISTKTRCHNGSSKRRRAAATKTS
jgi:hypothetical protein